MEVDRGEDRRGCAWAFLLHPSIFLYIYLVSRWSYGSISPICPVHLTLSHLESETFQPVCSNRAAAPLSCIQSAMLRFPPCVWQEALFPVCDITADTGRIFHFLCCSQQKVFLLGFFPPLLIPLLGGCFRLRF